MENTTKIIIAAGVILGGAVAVSYLMNQALNTDPTDVQEHRFLQSVVGVYGAKHMVRYTGTRRTAPDMKLLQAVIESETELAFKHQNLRFTFPKISIRDGYVELTGSQHNTTASCTIGPIF